MDAKTIIREMLKRGMTLEQIRENMLELGIENADELIAQAVEQEKPTGEQKPAPQAAAQAPQEEKAGKKQLFEAPKTQAAEKPRPQEVEEKPALAFTTISGGEEKEVSFGEGVGEKEKEGIMTEIAKTSFSDVDEVEKKLDETIALLKALQDINKKILETEREVLLRLKV